MVETEYKYIRAVELLVMKCSNNTYVYVCVYKNILV